MNKKTIIIIISLIAAFAIGFMLVNKDSITSYTDKESNFTIELPSSWNIVNRDVSVNGSNSLFSNGSSTITIKKFNRTDKVEQAIKFMGKDEFNIFLSDQVMSEIDGYKIQATSTVIINNLPFYAVNANYVGKNTQKDVTQKLYIVLNEKSYYIIGVDVYTELMSKFENEIDKIINSFKITS
jgi:hypothetical protein